MLDVPSVRLRFFKEKTFQTLAICTPTRKFNVDEALAIIEYMKLDHQIYYWRTASGVEVDFIAYGEKNLIAFEIKHTKNISPKMLRGLRQFKEDYTMAQLYILYLGTETLYLNDSIVALLFVSALQKMLELLKK